MGEVESPAITITVLAKAIVMKTIEGGGAKIDVYSMKWGPDNPVIRVDKMKSYYYIAGDRAIQHLDYDFTVLNSPIGSVDAYIFTTYLSGWKLGTFPMGRSVGSTEWAGSNSFTYMDFFGPESVGQAGEGFTGTLTKEWGYKKVGYDFEVKSLGAFKNIGCVWNDSGDHGVWLGWYGLGRYTSLWKLRGGLIKIIFNGDYGWIGDVRIEEMGKL